MIEVLIGYFGEGRIDMGDRRYGIWETERSRGKLRSWIRRYSTGTFLGMRPKGEMMKTGKGGWVKGPAIRPRAISFEIFS